MTNTDLRGLPIRYMEEVFNQRRFEVLDELFDPAILERIRQASIDFLLAFPDWHGAVDDVIVEGDRVVNRWSGRGTHQAELMGMPATGRSAALRGITIFRVAGGKVVEEWTQADLLGLMQQLGAAQNTSYNAAVAEPAGDAQPASEGDNRMTPEEETQVKAYLYDRITSGSNPVEIANKAIIARYVDATNAGELDLFDDFVDEDYLEHQPIPGQGRGREELKKAYVVFNTPFPDLEYIFEDLIAEGDLVIGRGVISGTHKGDFMGIPPSGKKIRWTGTRLFRLKDLHVTEGWINLDMMGMMQQMGVIPAPPAPDPSTFPPHKVITGAPSTREANKALMRRFIDEVWNKGNMAVADELFHPEHTSPSAPALPAGAEGTKFIANTFRNAFPDFHMAIDLMVAEDDRIAARFIETGTHLGELFGIPGTGKKVNFSEIGILRIADGKIVESWYDVDMLGMMQQLGVGG